MKNLFLAAILAAAFLSLPRAALSEPAGPPAAASPTPAGPLVSAGNQVVESHLPNVLKRLFARLARDESSQIPFTESRTFAISKQPVKQNGTLRSSKKYGLSMDYAGAKARVLIIDDRGLIERQPGGHERQIATTDHPELGTLTDLYLNLLRGNGSKLFVYADAYFAGTNRSWQLALVPHDASLAKRLGRVVISGSKRDILRIENVLPDGDSRVLELGIAQRNPRFTPEEIHAFFRDEAEPR